MSFTTIRTALVWGVALSLLVLLPSCDSVRPDLDVENENEPNRAQVLGTPSDVEGIATGLFRGYWSTYQSWGYAPLLETMSDTYSCNWANFGMNRMSSEPRVEWNNSSAYTYAGSTETPWFNGYTVISNSVDILQSIDRLGEEEFANAEINVTRLKAFTNFMMGLVYGKLAASFDRAFLVDESTDLEAVASGEADLSLQPYGTVTDFALQKLDKAQQFANQGDFEIPPAWVYGLTITDQQLIQLANSYKARIGAMTARTPSERQSLSHSEMASWSNIKSWVENGLEANGYSGQFGARTVSYSCRDINCPNQYDIPNQRKKTTPAGFAPISRGGFGAEGIDVVKWMSTQSNTWARADYRMIGPADVSNDASDCQGDASGDDGEISCYKEWQNTAVADRLPYLTETPDRRVQGPEGPEDHGKFFDYVGQALDAFPPSRGTYHYSDRTFVRYQYHPENQGPSSGEPMTALAKPEMDLLKAEACLHDMSISGCSKSTVADLINNTRVDNGELPPASDNTPMGSMSNPPNPTPGYPTDQPTLWSMLKYEFHIETTATASTINFASRRGWGDLPEGTPLHFPIPEQELNTLQKQVYTFGGVGGRCSAGNPSNCLGGSGGGSGSSSLSGLDIGRLETFLGRPLNTESSVGEMR